MRFTYFKEPVAAGVGMRLERGSLLVLGGSRSFGPGRRFGGGGGGRGHDAGPSVRALFVRYVLQIGGRPPLGHGSSLEHPIRRHGDGTHTHTHARGGGGAGCRPRATTVGHPRTTATGARGKQINGPNNARVPKNGSRRYPGTDNERVFCSGGARLNAGG